jgi:HK97 family phage prohead protease
VGRGGAAGDTIRKHVIGRAHTIGLADEIPNTWGASGALVSPGADGGMRSIDTGMDRIQYRFAADLELRAGGDGRTIVGIAVPYNQPQRIDDNLVEQFDGSAASGPFDHQLRAMHRVGYWNLHSVHGGMEVGHIKYARNDAAGLYTESFISPDGPDGDRTLDEIRSGQKPHQSVGFDVGPGGTQHRSGVAHRTRADLTELAAVPVGAYGAGAAVTAVRAAQEVIDGLCSVCGHSQAQERVAELRVLAAGLPKLA